MREGSALLYTIGTRLMCNACGIVSSKHHTGFPFEYIYTTAIGRSQVFTHGPYYACHHTCHRCGNDDITGIGFIDSGNYYSEDTDGICEWEEKLSNLESEIAVLKRKISEGKTRWEELWGSSEDAS